MLLARYIGRRVAGTFLAVLGASLGIVLAVDFADHANQFTGPGWGRAAALLYACKAAVMGYQLAPAALLVAVELAIASLKRRGEITAIRALGVSPWIVLLPCLVVGTALAAGLFVADESIVGRAGRKADEITTRRFQVWGDYSVWFGQRRWFRSGRTVYFLRDVGSDDSYENVSVFELTPGFRLSRRLDADSIRPLPDGKWQVRNGSLRTIDGAGGSTVTEIANGAVALEEPARSFAVRSGRPDQLRLGELRQEIDERRAVGLRDTPYIVELQAKLTHPILAVPIAAIGAALSLRQRRRDAVAVAMVEGLGASAVIWIGIVAAKGASLSGRLAPWAGPWLLLAIAVVAAAALVRLALSR